MIFVFDEYEVDDARFELRQRAEVVPVQPRVLDLLIYFVKNPGRIVARGELLSNVWGGVCVTHNAIVQAIACLRAALGDSDGRIIESVRSRGYRFTRSVRELTGDASTRARELVARLAASLDGKVELVLVDVSDREKLAAALEVLGATQSLHVLRSRAHGEPLAICLVASADVEESADRAHRSSSNVFTRSS